ncbi:sugar phosphate isomerase/epimerase family protein [Streptomyces zingiberis]|uniref:Sugar phosphate isomerase/epimerase n=1 Tax=Streptomyces zingiberis TaxID=2053010 RepID=A0ABX1C3Q8_9ACTN|nr:sugar phosphate isomerase/epimerase family protein [Streptomyces zingiberis]NJQ02562.1 sugar phosphate isomerase/epimerase [Streptomyces zingiberis]
MQLAFSTLGVPGMEIPEVVRLATEGGFHGVELRVHGDEPVHPGVGGEVRKETARRFQDAGLRVLSAAGYTRVAAPGADETVVDELHELLTLASDLNAPYVRVFPGGVDQPATEDADAAAARRLAAAAPYAADLGVTLCLETHDSHRTGTDTARVLGLVGHPSVGAIWDVMHPWLAGEDPETSYAVLAPYLAYVQVKDITSVEDTTPLPLGAGVLPLTECVDLLTRQDPAQTRPAAGTEWLCWEYEKRWYPEVPELPEVLRPGHDHLMGLLTQSA